MKDHIEDLKSELKDVCHLRESIFEKTRAWHDSCENVDTHEFGETIDVVKDLAETEEKLWKAMYYKLICCTMVEAEEEYDEERKEAERMGYNHNRYPSSGRFASAGHGMRMGYPHLPVEMWDRHMKARYGYPVYYDGDEHTGMGDVHTGYGENGTASRMGYPDRDRMDPDMEEQGRNYSRYRQARRHYTETKDARDKSEMDEHAMKHFGKALQTFKEIWADVQPEQRKKMKIDLEKLVNEMNV